ncbi:MAG: hypothetical protein HY820_13955 [Acidobacteria bacterium]|nr:hypothetical protein [Acidobacteriota bacterium]
MLQPGIAAPGGLANITCAGLASDKGITVKVDNNPAGILAVNSLGGGFYRIDFIVPPLALFASGFIRIEVKQSAAVSTVTIGFDNNVRRFAGYPADFLVDPNGEPRILHFADGSPVNSANPAQAGERVTLFATGMGPALPQLDERWGAFPLTLYRDETELLVRIQSESPEAVSDLIRADFAGLLPDRPGVYRIDVTIPDSTRGRFASISVERDFSCRVPSGAIGFVLRIIPCHTSATISIPLR